jgi:formylmethanofuran dehydrogenase subunit E
MPDSNNDKFVLKLVPCDRCGNPFMVKSDQSKSDEIVCENCIKLEQRKTQLASSVIESQKEIKSSIREYEDKIKFEESQEKKNLFYAKIKKQSEILTKSIELLKKIEETNDEKYIEEYKRLFDQLKKENI